MTCPTCSHAEVHGSWPQALLNRGGTHCWSCHRTWTGKREAHCVADGCCLHFSADSVADKHRVGGRCPTSEELSELRKEDGTPVVRAVDTPEGVLWRGGESLSRKLKPAWLVAS